MYVYACIYVYFQSLLCEQNKLDNKSGRTLRTGSMP